MQPQVRTADQPLAFASLIAGHPIADGPACEVLTPFDQSLVGRVARAVLTG